jgi:hypothetical protein
MLKVMQLQGGMKLVDSHWIATHKSNGTEIQPFCGILNVNRNHWITILMEQTDGKYRCTIYDSLNTPNISKNRIIKDILGWYSISAKDLLIGDEFVQENHFDCGPISLWNVATCIFGRKEVYDPKMRLELVCCSAELICQTPRHIVRQCLLKPTPQEAFSHFKSCFENLGDVAIGFVESSLSEQEKFELNFQKQSLFLLNSRMQFWNKTPKCFSNHPDFTTTDCVGAVIQKESRMCSIKDSIEWKYLLMQKEMRARLAALEVKN